MKMIKLFGLILLPIILVTSCRKNRDDNNSYSDTLSIVGDNTAFAVRLYKQLCSSKGNIFLSPYGISTAIALTYGGASGNTEKQMAETFCFSQDKENLPSQFGALQTRFNKIRESGKVRLSITNSLWAQQGHQFLESYLSLVKNYYNASVTPVDYTNAPDSVCKMINRWVEDKTEGKIKDIIQPGILNSQTLLVLVNAIYFKGIWESKFLGTKYSPFYATPDKSTQVPMMENRTEMNYAEDKNLQILEMPYIGRSFSMVVLLPKLIDGLAQIEKDLSSEKISYWKARMSILSVHIFLPKFTIGSGIDLKQTLKAMGMVDAFSLATADFSGMTGNKDMYIDSIVHEAFVGVNEEGTEATAATSIGGFVDGRSTQEKIKTFRADHPFLFLIIDNATGSILFIGRVSDPSKLN